MLAEGSTSREKAEPVPHPAFHQRPVRNQWHGDTEDVSIALPEGAFIGHLLCAGLGITAGTRHRRISGGLTFKLGRTATGKK